MTGKKRILVVDDDAEVVELLTEVLSKGGYEPEGAGSGQAALEKLKTQKPDLVLLDIKMPDMTGVEILRRIKEIDRNIIVVMLTGWGKEESIIKYELYDQGALDYLCKPISVKDLLDKIDKALSGSLSGG